MTEIDSCPFCGDQAKLRGVGEIDEPPYWYVCCYTCGATVNGSKDKEKAIANWNRRAYNMTAVLEYCLELIKTLKQKRTDNER